MSKSNAFETAHLLHLFNNTAIANIGDATGLPASAAPGSLYVALHTADPGEAGTAVTSETAYTNYARVAVARSSAGWTVSGNAATNAATITFPECGATGATITHFSVVTSASGAGMILHSGALTASRTIAAGTAPYFAAGELDITED